MSESGGHSMHAERADGESDMPCSRPLFRRPLNVMLIWGVLRVVLWASENQKPGVLLPRRTQHKGFGYQMVKPSRFKKRLLGLLQKSRVAVATFLEIRSWAALGLSEHPGWQGLLNTLSLFSLLPSLRKLNSKRLIDPSL